MKTAEVEINGKRITVHDDGTVYSLRGKLKPQLDKAGYSAVHINGKRILVHRLIAQAFLSDFDQECEVHHLNEVKSDNRAENLVCMTRLEHQHLHKQIYPITKKCTICGKEFIPNPTKRKRAKTCSKECAAIAVKISASKRKRAVNQYSKDGCFIKQWDSFTSIEKAMHLSPANVAKCCKKLIHSCGGFVWKYSDESEVMT